MEFLKYSNETQSNIIPKDEFEGMTREVFNIIATNLSKSLGPLGSSATILDGMMTDATKDGYAILSKYRFHNRYKKMIYNLIMAPCIRMNNTVGDGTTTAIDLTNNLYNRYYNNKNKIDTLYRLPRHFTKIWDSIIEDISNRIQSKSTPVDPEDYDTIYNLAYVTSNGNDEISKNIAKVYAEAKSPGIKQKNSPTNKSYISPINGFDFPANLISDSFVRNEDLTAEENDIAVMVFNFKIETDMFTNVIAQINSVLRAMHKKLLVIAPFFDSYMCDTVLNQHVTREFNSGGINCIMAQYNTGKLEKHQLEDLATILRTKVINQDIANGLMNEIANNSVDAVVQRIVEDDEYSFYRFIGHADNVLLSCNTGCIFKVKDIKEDKTYIEVLNRAIQDLEDIKGQTDMEKKSYSMKIYDANARILQLQMKNYIYYIGADSELQKSIIWDSVEDVIKCLKSAIKYGSVPGCQLSIVRSCEEAINEILPADSNNDDANNLSNDDKLRVIILSLISEAIIDTYSHVLHGPDGKGIIKTLPRWEYTKEDGKDQLIKEAVNKGAEIIAESIERNEVFDMETLDFNKNIITSAETDRMVLSVASELVKILISGNQCVFLDSDIDESHEEMRSVYV